MKREPYQIGSSLRRDASDGVGSLTVIKINGMPSISTSVLTNHAGHQAP